MDGCRNPKKTKKETDYYIFPAFLQYQNLEYFEKVKDILIGGSTIVNGTVKAYVTAVGEDSVLGNILKMVKDAQTEKPPVQLLADKISAIFVPVVVGISLLTFVLNYTIGSQDFTASLMRSIAVLVISCPCAMGLATPAAIAVGLGRAARNGVLFKNTKTLELFKDIQQVVFDKTGTLTTGQFAIAEFELTEAELGFFDNNGNYLVEPGMFKIMVGTSSVKGLEGEFELK